MADVRHQKKQGSAVSDRMGVRAETYCHEIGEFSDKCESI